MDFVHARLREVSASHPAVRLSVKQRLGLAPPPTRHPHAPQHRPSPQQQQHAHTAQHGHGVPLMRCRTSPVPAMQALAAASAATVAVRQLRRSGTALSPAAFTSPGARVAVTVPSARVEEDGRAGVATEPRPKRAGSVSAMLPAGKPLRRAASARVSRVRSQARSGASRATASAEHAAEAAAAATGDAGAAAGQSAARRRRKRRVRDPSRLYRDNVSWLAQRGERLAQQRRELEARELDGCTFQPFAADADRGHAAPAHVSERAARRFFKRNVDWQRRKAAWAEKQLAKEEVEQLAECTFQPCILPRAADAVGVLLSGEVHRHVPRMFGTQSVSERLRLVESDEELTHQHAAPRLLRHQSAPSMRCGDAPTNFSPLSRPQQEQPLPAQPLLPHPTQPQQEQPLSAQPLLPHPTQPQLTHPTQPQLTQPAPQPKVLPRRRPNRAAPPIPVRPTAAAPTPAARAPPPSGSWSSGDDEFTPLTPLPWPAAYADMRASPAPEMAAEAHWLRRRPTAAIDPDVAAATAGGAADDPLAALVRLLLPAPTAAADGDAAAAQAAARGDAEAAAAEARSALAEAEQLGALLRALALGAGARDGRRGVRHG